MAYSYYFKNTHYFRKIIHHKYIKDRETYLNYRRSLKLCVDEDFYYYLESNNKELDKIIDYINFRLTKKLKEGNRLEVVDINQFIENICIEYKNQACIENSDLEKKRISNLEYLNENGMQQGFHLHAITTKYKEMDSQYKNFSDKEITQKLGMEIIKRSNINIENVLKEITADKLLDFFEILIKNERDVLKNDIKVYIQRNLNQFYPLIPSYVTEEGHKVEEALYQYLDLVSQQPKQKSYLDFIKKNSIKHQPQQQGLNLNDISEERLFLKIKEAFAKEEQEKKIDTSLNIDSLIDKYMKYRTASDTVSTREKNTLIFFSDYLKGDENSYKSKNLEELTSENVLEFENLISDATPKDKEELKNKTLFELVEYRKNNDALRYFDNSAEMMEFDIKNFWKYICKYVNHNLNPKLFDGFNLLYNLKEKKYNENEQDRLIRAFKITELQEFINVVYNEKEIKKILMDSPRNFYSFFFGLMFGVRIGEFTYIRTENVKVQEKNGKRAYFIYLNEDIKPQSLKNENSHRNICIPEVLIDLGFLNYVDLRRKRNKEWLWDFPASGYGSISMFYQRHIKNLFPDFADTKENRLKRKKDFNVIQLRSLRKNFAEYIFSETGVKEHTNENAKRLIGHAEGSTTAVYLGRIEPIKGKMILDYFEDYDLDLIRLKNDVESYYKVIKRDLDIKDNNDWMIKSKVKPRKGRKV